MHVNQLNLYAPFCMYLFRKLAPVSSVRKGKWIFQVLLRSSLYLYWKNKNFQLFINLYRRYDFYLVSQSVRQGTVSPTHYNIIEDTTGLQPDHIQRLTYKFTHLYFNCSVSVIILFICYSISVI